MSSKEERTARIYITTLIAIQLFGICAALVAMEIKLGTILFSGPILSVIGLLITYSCYIRRLTWGLYFGLSASLTSVFSFCFVFGAESSTEIVRSGMIAIILLGALVAFILGVIALIQVQSMRLTVHHPKFLYFPIAVAGFVLFVVCTLLSANANLKLLTAVGIWSSFSWVYGYYLKCYHHQFRDKEPEVEEDVYEAEFVDIESSAQPTVSTVTPLALELSVFDDSNPFKEAGVIREHIPMSRPKEQINFGIKAAQLSWKLPIANCIINLFFIGFPDPDTKRVMSYIFSVAIMISLFAGIAALISMTKYGTPKILVPACAGIALNLFLIVSAWSAVTILKEALLRAQ
ncbi:MAG: hypothetical protein COA78_14200 [Blastopirellula sp.]|nr:MAG: hypothetical protein COA78_14200 [Blastopirellula sp.]